MMSIHPGVIAIAVTAVFTTASFANKSSTVGNEHITRTLSVTDGKLETQSIHNGITKKDHTVSGHEFRLGLPDGRVLTSDDFAVVGVRGGTGRSRRAAAWHLRSAEHHLQAVIRYATSKPSPGLSKTITITNTGDAPITITWIDVEHCEIDNEPVEYSANPDFPTLTDYGQPVLLDSLWIGLEHPAAHVAADSGGMITCRHHPGRTLKSGESLTSKTAVLAAAAKGSTRRAFEAYVEEGIRYYPGPPRVFFWWNGFRVIKPPDRLTQGLKMADYLLEKLHKPYGHVFDAFSYDAGFAVYQKTGLFSLSEPELWTKTKERIAGSDLDLGFWASFSCTYDTDTHDWGAKQGFGLQHGRAYCLAEPTYHKAVKARLLEIVRTHDMKVISFDGMRLNQGYGCNTSGHGHYVSDGPDAGYYGTEAVVDAALDIYHAIREIQPDICLDFFVCGEWASPWWLSVIDGVHSVGGDTIGCDIPSPELRDELITARDIQAFELHRHQGRPFPLWAEDLYGFQVRSDHLIDGIKAVGEDYTDKWENEYVLSFAGRGTITSYIACSDLPLLGTTPTGMKFLADVNHFVRHNRAIYRHTKFILGDPANGEVCGYAHGDRDGRCLVALHNPRKETRVVNLTIDGQLDLAKSQKPFVVHMIYPERATLGEMSWGKKADITLHGYEVMLLDVRRTDINTLRFPRPVPQALPAPEVRTDGLQIREGTAPLHAHISVPASHDNSELLIYLQTGEQFKPVAEVKVDGEAAPVAIRSRSRRGREEAWIIVPLTTGENSIFASISGVTGLKQGGAWVRSALPGTPQGKGNDIRADEPLLPTLPAGYRQQYWAVGEAND